jgi:hypothetical protein
VVRDLAQTGLPLLYPLQLLHQEEELMEEVETMVLYQDPMEHHLYLQNQPIEMALQFPSSQIFLIFQTRSSRNS